MSRTPRAFALALFLSGWVTGGGWAHAQYLSVDVPLPAASGEEIGAAGFEPAPLPGNLPEQTEMAYFEPSLPQADGPVVETPTELAPQENSPMPRRFRYALNVELRGVYDDNVTLASNAENESSDYSGQASFGVVLGLGDVLERGENFVAFNYTPTAYFYLDNTEFNTFEHVGSLQAQWRLGRFTLGVSQDLSSVESTNLGVANEAGGFNNQTNLDIGGRRRVTSYSTRFDASAELFGKTSFRFGAQYSLSEPEGLIGSESISGTVGVSYQYGPKLTLGLGITAGQNFVEGSSPDQTFEQVNINGAYEISGKLSANGSFGVEFRQSEIGSEDQASPIFQLGLSYQPFDGTSINLSGTRRTLNSASAFGQDFTSTQFTIGARQRLFNRFFFTLSAGYQNQTYFSTIGGLDSDRDDNYYFIVPGIDVRIMNFWFAGIYYVSRQNDSSSAPFSFDSNQIGVRSNLQF